MSANESERGVDGVKGTLTERLRLLAAHSNVYRETMLEAADALRASPPVTRYVVIGHVTPTDAEPDPAVQGRLDEGIEVIVAATRQEAERQLLWVQDGLIREIACGSAS